MAGGQVMLGAGILLLFFAVLFFFIGGRSAMLEVCTGPAFACAVRDAAGYLAGPVGWMAGAGALLLAGAAMCFRLARRIRV